MKNLYISILLVLIGTTSWAQNFEPDASIWLDPWVSCSKSPNPKSEYGETHWIQYDLGAIRTLSKTWVWNVNDPTRLDQGFKTVRIDYSTDGRNWIFLEQIDFPKAQGKAVYSGFTGPNLVGIEAKYVLLTVISTHGNDDCAGLSEIKFNLLPSLTEADDLGAVTSLASFEEEAEFILYPNPAREKVNLLLDYNGESELTVYSVEGKLIYQDEIETRENIPIAFEVAELPPGLYVVQIINEEFQMAKRFVVE